MSCCLWANLAHSDSCMGWVGLRKTVLTFFLVILTRLLNNFYEIWAKLTQFDLFLVFNNFYEIKNIYYLWILNFVRVINFFFNDIKGKGRRKRNFFFKREGEGIKKGRTSIIQFLSCSLFLLFEYGIRFKWVMLDQFCTCSFLTLPLYFGYN